MHHTVSSLFLTAVGQAVAELLVHHPCNCASRSHPIEQMRFSIFSFFDNRKTAFTAFRAFIADTVVFDDFQLCRDKDQFTAYKLLTDPFQRGITGRAEPVLFRDIQIFLFTGRPLKRSAFVARAFLFFREAVQPSPRLQRPQDPVPFQLR